MASNPTTPESIEKARREIHDLVREIAELSKQDLEVEDYFQQFLGAVVAALAAAGGVVWKPGDSREPEQICQINLKTTEIAVGGEDEARQLIETLGSHGVSLKTPP